MFKGYRGLNSIRVLRRLVPASASAPDPRPPPPRSRLRERSGSASSAISFRPPRALPDPRLRDHVVARRPSARDEPAHGHRPAAVGDLALAQAARARTSASALSISAGVLR